jgi:NADPH:quinone reductase-like Zn-dependent oxidoreductase
MNGASGAVGSSAVQIAKAFEAEVTGVCSTANLALVRSLGVDRAIDYSQEDFTAGGETYDIILDAAGKSSFSRGKGLLADDGVYLTGVPSPPILWQTLRSSVVGCKKARFAATGLRPAANKAMNLVILAQMAEVGELRAVIDRRYPL